MARREEALGIYKEAQAQEEWVIEQRELIEKKKRLPARWGYIIDRDFGDMSYVVEYPKITDKFGDKHVMPLHERNKLLKQGFTARTPAPDSEELRIPEPRYPDASPHWEIYADRDWWFPLISAREAELAEWRFTGNKKKIVDLLSTTQEGSYVLNGRNGLGEALLEVLTPHGEYDEDEDNYESARVLLRSLRNMVNWGLVYVFEHQQHPENVPDFLIQSAPILQRPTRPSREDIQPACPPLRSAC